MDDKNKLSHINQRGEALMVDISEKADTKREAAAIGRIKMSEECFDLLMEGKLPKGDVLAAARIAGIMGAKKTSELIPLCHIIALTGVSVDFETDREKAAVTAICRVKTVGKTGAEMETLTGVSTALLTIYDMCKAVCKTMVIEDIHLAGKKGGKSGSWGSFL